MLLNEEISRMQVLAGMGPEKHAFETLLESFSHLTINELKTRLFEADENTEEKAADYFETLSDKEQKSAAALASKIPSAALNLTADEFGDKVANLAPNKEVVKTPLWKRVVTGALALIIAANSIASPIATAFKNDNNIKKIELQAKQAQSKLNQANTADFNDSNNIKQAKKLNPSLDNPGDEALHIQYKTSGYAIKDQQRQDTKNFADNVIDVVDDGNSVEVNATSTYSHQPDDPDNENKSVDGKKLDDARANSFKAVSKEDIKLAAAKKGYKVTEEGDNLKIKTPKGVKTVKITSKIAKQVGKANKIGDVDQGTVVDTEVIKDTPENAKAIWQNYQRDGGLPRMPKDDSNSGGEEKPDREPIVLDIPPPPSVGDSDPGQAEFLKKQNLNRNQEIFSVLKMSNPNIKGDPTDRTYKSWDDNVKKVVIDLRKSPDVLLNKFKTITGIEIPKRQKSTGIFKRSGVAEGILFETLLSEAAIDTKLASIGVTDDAIRKNKVEVMAMLADMYNLKSTDIPDFKKLTPAEQKQFKTITGELDDTISKQQSADVKQITKDIESNTSLKTALSRINNYDEFEALILGMAALVNPNFAKQKQDIKSALFNLSNKIKAMKEESETPTDTQGVYKIIDTLKLLKTHLENVNSKQEFEELIFALLPHIDPKGTITQDKNRLASAIMAASNRNSLKDTKPVDLDQLGR
jgi:hypothetical protein